MKADEIRCKYCGRLGPRPGDRCPSGQECKAAAVKRYDWQAPQAAKVTTSHSRTVQIMIRQWQDALSEATADYWERRAQQFENAAPKPDEYHGQADDEALRDSWVDCMATASACRRHAAILRDNPPEDITYEVWDALEQVA